MPATAAVPATKRPHLPPLRNGHRVSGSRTGRSLSPLLLSCNGTVAVTRSAATRATDALFQRLSRHFGSDRDACNVLGIRIEIVSHWKYKWQLPLPYLELACAVFLHPGQEWTLDASIQLRLRLAADRILAQRQLPPEPEPPEPATSG